MPLPQYVYVPNFSFLTLKVSELELTFVNMILKWVKKKIIGTFFFVDAVFTCFWWIKLPSHVYLPLKHLPGRWAEGWVCKKKKTARPHSCFQQLHAFTSLMSPLRTLSSHTSLTEAQQTISPALSQLCTLVSGVAQNFATSCELIRHIFSGFWEDRKRVMPLHHRHSRGLVQQCLYTPSISDKCQYSGFRSSLLMRGHILDVSNICTDFIHYEGPFIHSSREDKAGMGAYSWLLGIGWLVKGT